MKKALLPLAFTLALVAAPASAQSVDLSLPGSWTQTWFGCDPGRSCHRIVFSMQPDPDPTSYWIIVNASWQSWFFTPGVAYRFLPYPIALEGFDVWNPYDAYVWYDEFVAPWNFAWPKDTRLTDVYADVSYGPLNGSRSWAEESWGSAKLDLVSATYATPEPASLIFIGTGLVGLAGAYRRRRNTRDCEQFTR